MRRLRFLNQTMNPLKIGTTQTHTQTHYDIISLMHFAFTRQRNCTCVCVSLCVCGWVLCVGVCKYVRCTRRSAYNAPINIIITFYFRICRFTICTSEMVCACPLCLCCTCYVYKRRCTFHTKTITTYGVYKDNHSETWPSLHTSLN